MATQFKPPYYAVIFISRLSEDINGYDQTAYRMLELAQTMPGFLGFESAREVNGITVSFWRDEASINHWKQHSEHQQAQQSGKSRWYEHYEMHIARVERYKSYTR